MTKISLKQIRPNCVYVELEDRSILFSYESKEGQSISDFEACVIDTYCLSQGLKSPLIDE